MIKRQLAGKKVAPIGLGCMGMSEFYGPSDEAQSISVLERALELGVDHFDTADMYGDGHNETLVGRLLRVAANRNKIILATKCGIKRDLNDPSKRFVDNSPEYIKAACKRSLDRLTTHIDLYYLHRISNLGTNIEESMSAMADLLAEGAINAVGLSEANIQTIRRADAALRKFTDGKHSLAALQTEFSLISRDIELNGILKVCEELGIAIVAYSPISRGLLTGQINSLKDLDETDFRRTLPRFREGVIDHNAMIAREISRIAPHVGATPAQIALSWALSRSPSLHAIPGTRRIKYLEQNWVAGEVVLSADTRAAIDRYLDTNPVSGPRYAPEILKAYGIETSTAE
ncbi:MAG: aldo/keto reductase [Methylovirgula sp.]